MFTPASYSVHGMYTQFIVFTVSVITYNMRYQIYAMYTMTVSDSELARQKLPLVRLHLFDAAHSLAPKLKTILQFAPCIVVPCGICIGAASNWFLEESVSLIKVHCLKAIYYQLQMGQTAHKTVRRKLCLRSDH